MNINYSNLIDKKWQRIWDETGIYKFNKEHTLNKLFLLEMFSYPSGKNLHIGHWWNFGLSDCYGRLKRMQGYNVFHPPGFDAFGLPAENYAIKTGIHPEDSTKKSIDTMEMQMRSMGTTYDWEYEIITCCPEYYKWTQWLFLKLFEHGFAYRKEAPVNWCPSCSTVLANEQVISGRCERCDSEVFRQNMTQWFFKLTEYAEELLTGLNKLDWPEKTKKIQENWIGKSLGCEIYFNTSEGSISVFTTRAETLMGVSYIVLSPEHPLAVKLTAYQNRQAVEEYIALSSCKSEIERLSTDKEKTGVFTGSYAEHPITKKMIPIWISDYVIMSYGTGAVMSVPAHDERDYAFAQKYGLPVLPVIYVPGQDNAGLPICGDGLLINSGEYDGLGCDVARDKIHSELELKKLGARCIKYRLRDWLVSRQRYWGTPIPIIYCDACGTVPVPESELPVYLPYDVAFKPTGSSPLASCESFVNTPCPVCGKPAKRETDTLDTFVCSSWYYLRFINSKNNEQAFDREKTEQIMPVDKYVGGVEHASMHLLYARFITKALRDMGYLSFSEPFTSLIHQGNILDRDGKKMSKRSGAVAPDEYIETYGSDSLRMYLCFGFSYRDGGIWNDTGIYSMFGFLKKVGRLVEGYINSISCAEAGCRDDQAEMEYIRNYTIKQVTADIDNFKFNTAIARIMEFANAIFSYQQRKNRNREYEETLMRDLILLLAPLAPHFTEELWQALGYEYSVHNQPYPICDEAKLIKESISIAVQINGRLRDVIAIAPDSSDADVKKLVLENVKIQSIINGREIKRIILVKNRLINIIL